MFWNRKATTRATAPESALDRADTRRGTAGPTLPGTRVINPGGMPRVLRIDASARHDGSVSRQLTDHLIAALRRAQPSAEITTRDLEQGVPLLNETMVSAFFLKDQEPTAEQAAALAASHTLIDEVKAADVLVLGVPIYNFGVPGVLKAWIDLIARAGLTFRYTETGPVGLLSDKKVYIVITSGGTAVGSEIDWASGFLRHIMGFVGLTDVEVIAADRLMVEGDTKVAAAKAQIDGLFDLHAAA